MNYYDIITQLANSLKANPLVAVVTEGEIDEANINRLDMYPLCHIVTNTCNITERVLSFNMSVIACDVVKDLKESTVNKLLGSDNETDCLNQTLIILNRLAKEMMSGDLAYSNFQVVEGSISLEPFRDRFANKLAGWTMTFDVEIENNMSVC